MFRREQGQLGQLNWTQGAAAHLCVVPCTYKSMSLNCLMFVMSSPDSFNGCSSWFHCEESS